MHACFDFVLTNTRTHKTFLVYIIAQPNMQETCRCSTDSAMASNIILENKIGNPRTPRKKSEIKTKNRSNGVESDLDSKTPRTQWPGDRGFSQVEILFFLFYIYTIIFSKSEIAAKKK